MGRLFIVIGKSQNFTTDLYKYKVLVDASLTTSWMCSECGQFSTNLLYIYIYILLLLNNIVVNNLRNVHGGH